jgi:hypothetical protein
VDQVVGVLVVALVTMVLVVLEIHLQPAQAKEMVVERDLLAHFILAVVVVDHLLQEERVMDPTMSIQVVMEQHLLFLAAALLTLAVVVGHLAFASLAQQHAVAVV